MTTPTAEDRMQKAIACVIFAIVFLVIFVGWSVLKLVGLL